MCLLRTTKHTWPDRGFYAPNVVMHKSDLDARSESTTPNQRASSGSCDCSTDGISIRYLDKYGHDVSPYAMECSADLEGLQLNIAFGEDGKQGDGSAAACRGVRQAAALGRFVSNVINYTIDAAVLATGCFLSYLVSSRQSFTVRNVHRARKL